MKQRDVRAPVRVVLDRRDARRHAVLATLEVDDLVTALVPAAAVPARDTAVRVTAAGLGLARHQRLLGLGARDLAPVDPRREATRGGGWLVLLDRHRYSATACAPSKSSIRSPGVSSTTAFFQLLVRPQVHPRFLGLDRTAIVLTSVTVTSQ